MLSSGRKGKAGTLEEPQPVAQALPLTPPVELKPLKFHAWTVVAACRCTNSWQLVTWLKITRPNILSYGPT